MSAWKILVIVVVCAALATLVAGCLEDDGNSRLSVFHAGSLSGPFSELETMFEELHPGVDVQLEAAGSAVTIRKVTELGKEADVVASADYSLIPKMMMPEYADFYVQFATNQLVIAYTEYSVYHEELTANNWFEIMMRPDVRFGFSNPNDDPCGYRSLMLVQLSAMHYGVPGLFENMIGCDTDYSVVESGGNFTIMSPLEPAHNTSKIMIRSAEVDLLAALESGEIDYLFIYRSVAVQHEHSGVSFLELPPEINLGDPLQDDLYGRVTLMQFAGIDDIERIVNVTASPIVYGVTVPLNAPHGDMAAAFLELLLGADGRQVFTNMGQPPIVPPRCNDLTLLPDVLQPLCTWS